MMPRYSREKLLGVSCQRRSVEPVSRLCAISFVRMHNCCRSRNAYAPLMSDDLLEAVEHAIVGVCAGARACLELSNRSHGEISLCLIVGFADALLTLES